MENQAERIPDYFSEEFDIPESAIDYNHHVNNVMYVQWMQDIAIRHSDSKHAEAVMDRIGCTWMVRTHHIEYKSQAFFGDRLRVTTWVAEYSKVTCKRCCKFERVSDGALILSSETTWVFVDKNRGRPAAIPDEIKDLYTVKS